MDFGQAEGIPPDLEKRDLVNFSYEMADKLIAQAVRFLESPNHAGVNIAIFLLLDAQKYLYLHPYAKGEKAPSLVEAALKFNEWNTLHYGNG